MIPKTHNIASAGAIAAALLVAMAAAPALGGTDLGPRDDEAKAAITQALQRQADLIQAAAALDARQQALRAEMTELEAHGRVLRGGIDEANMLLRSALAAAGSDAVPTELAALAMARGRGQEPGPVQTTAAPPPEAVGERPKAERALPELAAAPDRGGVLLPPGSFSIEPMVDYIRSDVTRAEVVGFSVLPGVLLGDIVVTDANRDTIVASVTGRVGLMRGLEAEIRVPYIYRSDTVALRPVGEAANGDVEVPSDGAAFGDVEAAIHMQLLSGNASRPFVVGHLRGRFPTGVSPFGVPRDQRTGAELELPTGTGFYSVQPSVSLLWPSDPAVLFANLTYQHTFKRDKGEGFGLIAPGDQFGASVGLGLSLNDKLSLSISYDHSMVRPTEQNGARVTGSQTLQLGTMLFGATYRLQSGNLWQVTIGSGVTADAPDLRVGVRRSYRFDWQVRRNGSRR
ncbi:transporter [uncultured Phenylobacterium sp.]|uniref:transporter n=1 Tax=uncultured Phenylobacterium sp. TaxID=349273 RepID=UPI0025D3BC2D|nr:transporter [uncultured Phenylobacterium sp.]